MPEGAVRRTWQRQRQSPQTHMQVVWGGCLVSRLKRCRPAMYLRGGVHAVEVAHDDIAVDVVVAVVARVVDSCVADDTVCARMCHALW